MTRKEEIRNASVAYNEKIGKLLVIGGDNILSEEEYLEFNKNPAFIAGALWADKTVLDKACEWLMLNADDYIFEGVEEYSSAMRHDFIENFRKAMEE